MPAPRPLLLARRRYPGPAFEQLGESCRVAIVEEPLRGRIMAGEHTDAACLFTFRDRIDDELCDRLPLLRVVANYGVGIETVDRDALSRRGIALVVPTGANAEAVADHAFALMLAVRHRLVEMDTLARRGGFEDPGYVERLGDDLFGSTLGIVGLGAIGRAVARRARGFGMPTVYAAPRAAPTAVERELGVDHRPLGELLAVADVVTLHCPLSASTTGLIGASELAAMRPGAILVNTSRGAVCDELALVGALTSGHLAGAGLDVFADEPHIPLALRSLSTVVMTPHIADATIGTRHEMTRRCVDGILAVLAGAPM